MVLPSTFMFASVVVPTPVTLPSPTSTSTPAASKDEAQKHGREDAMHLHSHVVCDLFISFDSMHFTYSATSVRISECFMALDRSGTHFGFPVVSNISSSKV